MEAQGAWQPLLPGALQNCIYYLGSEDLKSLLKGKPNEKQKKKTKNRKNSKRVLILPVPLPIFLFNYGGESSRCTARSSRFLPH